MRGFNEYPRMLFKVDEGGTELTCSVADASEKAWMLANGWQTRYLAWCDGPLQGERRRGTIASVVLGQPAAVSHLGAGQGKRAIAGTNFSAATGQGHDPVRGHLARWQNGVAGHVAGPEALVVGLGVRGCQCIGRVFLTVWS